MSIPNNINDAIQAARDGELGVIDQIKIGDILVDALTGLDDTEILSITRKPIQDGTVMTDAAIEDVQPLVMDIVLANPQYSLTQLAAAALTGDTSGLSQTWRDDKRQLYQYKKDLELLEVQDHQSVHQNCLIQSITPRYDTAENLDCFWATVVFERMMIFGQSEQSDNKLASLKQNVGSL
ncbi:hypothetical protein KAR91_53405 [Candidatus Pacearchaeota archaeon]|nr:hypothetical protein [Candidatus Pacearchaeota archaeon]